MDTDGLHIPDDEIEWSFTRSGGPGGQNVNKVASCAVLRWKASTNATLPPGVRARLLAQQSNRVNAEGELLIRGQKYRDQERNKADCLDRLAAMLRAAKDAPVPRRATKPTKGSQRRRLAEKKMRSERRQGRSGRHEGE